MFCHVFVDFGMHFNYMLALICDQSFILKRTRNLIDFGIDFGCILDPFWFPFGSQNLPKNQYKPPLEHRESPGACPGAWGSPKGTQNGSQSEPWTPKIRSLATPRPPKWSSRHPQNITKASQNATEINPKFIQEAKKHTSKINPNVPKLETKMDPTWSSAGTKFCCTIWPNILKEMPQRG